MLKREEYRLRPMEELDLAQVLEWRNSDRIRANMYTDHIITMNEHRAWFEKIRQEPSTVYRIFEFQCRPVGVANATQIDRCNNKCFWAFYLGDTNLPAGSGAVMEFLFLEYIFEELKIRKLCCEVFAFNRTTIKLHKKFGFKEEGCLKQHMLKNKKYEDVVIMALFNEEWMSVKSKLKELYFCK